MYQEFFVGFVSNIVPYALKRLLNALLLLAKPKHHAAYVVNKISSQQIKKIKFICLSCFKMILV